MSAYATTSPALGYRQENTENRLFTLAIVASLLLHLGLYVVLPYLKTNAVAPFKRIEVELDTAVQQPEAPPAPVQPPLVEQPKTESAPPQVVKREVTPTKPIERTPVLTSKASDAPRDYVAPAAPPAPIAVTPESVAEPVKQASAEPGESTTQKPVESTAVEQASPDEAWGGYGQALFEMVGKNKNYPAIAIRRNLEGEAKVLAKFVQGKLVDVTLVGSSGHEVLDKEALSMLRKAVALLPLRGNLANKNFTVTVPVDFKLSEQ